MSSLADVPDDASQRTSAPLFCQPSPPRVSSQQAAAFCSDVGGPGDRHRGGSSSRPGPILSALAIGEAGPAGAGTPLAPALHSAVADAPTDAAALSARH